MLEELKVSDIESGIRTERFNMRGVVTKAMFEGGDQERELARKHRRWLESRRQYPRTAALLDQIARSWDDDAKFEDTRAQQDKLRS
jgi:alpha/beta superfamily hydrolase